MARKTPEDIFLKYRHKLENECVIAFSTWSIYKQLENFVHTNNKAINVSPAFYSVCKITYLSQTLILLSKILEKRKKYNLNLQGYLEFVEKNSSIFIHIPCGGLAVHLRRDRLSLQDVEETRKKLKAWRDKEIAHTDIKLLKGASGIKRPLVREVDSLFKLIEQIFNRYSSYYDRRSFAFRLINIGDLRYTIDLVEKAMERERRLFQKYEE